MLNYESVELRQLVYFDAVVRHGGFTRAAEQLRVAQPAVSAQIRRLESELGVALLERTTRKVRLTRAGELVLARARRAFDELDAARDDLAQLAGSLRGRVRIGSIQATGPFDLPAALAAFHRRFPEVELSLRSGRLRRLLGLLDADEIDLAIGPLPSPPNGRIAAAPLFTDELVLITAPDHPLADHRELSLAQLREDAFACLPAESGLRRVLDRHARRPASRPGCATRRTSCRSCASWSATDSAWHCWHAPSPRRPDLRSRCTPRCPRRSTARSACCTSTAVHSAPPRCAATPS